MLPPPWRIKKKDSEGFYWKYFFLIKIKPSLSERYFKQNTQSRAWNSVSVPRINLGNMGWMRKRRVNCLCVCVHVCVIASFCCLKHTCTAVLDFWRSQQENVKNSRLVLFCCCLIYKWDLPCSACTSYYAPPGEKWNWGHRVASAVINPRRRRMGDDFKQKVCLSQRGKGLQGREEMLNINMDHRSQDVVTDATAVSADSKRRVER